MILALILGLVDYGFASRHETALLHHAPAGRVVDEMPADEEALAFDAIKEAIEGDGSFVTSDHTLERYRIDPWYSQVSIHSNTVGDPNAALYASIQKRIDSLLAGYQRPELAPEKRAALDELMRSIGMKEEDINRV